MAGYSDSYLRWVVDQVSSAINYLQPSKKVKIHLWTVGRIAMMMRKFEKAGSDNYKKSLEYIFSKDDAITQLIGDELDSQLLAIDKLINLAHTVRKFELTWQDLKTVYTRMDIVNIAVQSLKCNHVETMADPQVSYWFSLILKYLSRNAVNRKLHQSLNVEEVLDVLVLVNENTIKSELVWTLGYILASLSLDAIPIDNVLNTEIRNKINALFVSGVSDESKAFLMTQMNMFTGSTCGAIQEQFDSYDLKNSTTMVSRPKGKKQAIVSKTTQTVKSSVKNQQADDVQMKILNLANALRSRSRKMITTTNKQHHETVEDNLGDDRSMWRSTWSECLNLYNLSRTGSKALKKDDKDNYLPSKLFGAHYILNLKSKRPTARPFHTDVRIVYSMFINRMIVGALKNICEQQDLNDKAVNALLKCVDRLEELPIVSPFKTCDRFSGEIVDCVCADYENIEGLDGPDLLRTFYDAIKDVVMMTEVKKDWLWREYKVKTRRTSYDKDKVCNLVRKELGAMRLDAAVILHTTACRSPKLFTKERAQKLKHYLSCKPDDYQAKDEEDFRSKLLEIIGVINESDSGLDFKELFDMYLNILTSSNSLQQNRQAVNFMIRETRDPVRCEILITSEVLDKLMKLLHDDEADTSNTEESNDEIKVLVLEVINNYIEYECCSNGLSDAHLHHLVEKIISNDNENVEVVEGALISILLTASKRHSLPKRLVSQLIGILDKPFGNFLLLILSRCQEQAIHQERDLELLSEKLRSEYVVVETEGQMVKIEKRSDLNAGSTPIALIAAQLLLKAVESSLAVRQSKENEAKSALTFGTRLYNTIRDVLVSLVDGCTTERTAITAKTFENLIDAIDGCWDKQVTLVSAKVVYLLSVVPKQALCRFSKETLKTLHGIVDNEDYLISTYCRAAYLRGLATLSDEKDPLVPEFMESISSLYVLQGTMKIGEYDFVSEINEHVLMIIASEAGKGQKFEDEELFQMFEGIIYENKNSDYSLKILEILGKYTLPHTGSSMKPKSLAASGSGSFKIPQSTIGALEHALSVLDLASDALSVLMNVIVNGQQVGTKTLLIFADDLQTSDNSRRRLRAFKLLERARSTHDVDDEIIDKLELVRAAYGLSSCSTATKAMKQSMLLFIKKKSEKSDCQLPFDATLILELYANEDITLDIAFNLSRNHQILRENLLNKLIERFNPNEFCDLTIRLIEIFENIANNNQTLSVELLEKLDNFLDMADAESDAGDRSVLSKYPKDKDEIEVKVMSIFVQCIQKGHRVSKCVIEKIFKRINSTKLSLVLKQELLGAVGSIALQLSEEDITEYKGKIQDILCEGLMSDNSKTQKICVSGWATLMGCTQIDEKYLIELVEMCTDVGRMKTFDDEILEKLVGLLQNNLQTQSGLVKSYLKIKLEMAVLAKMNNENDLLEKLACHLNDPNREPILLDQNYNQLANILNRCSKEMKTRVLHLLESSQVKYKMNVKLIESLALLYDRTKSKETKQSCVNLLLAISMDKTSKLCTHVKLSARVKKILHLQKERTNIELYRRQFLESSPLYTFFSKELKLSESHITSLIGSMDIMDMKLLTSIKTPDEFLEVILASSTSSKRFYESPSAAFLIKELLIHADEIQKFKRPLGCYARFLKQGTFQDQNLESLVEVLLNFYNTEMGNELLELFVECIFLSVTPLIAMNLQLAIRCLNYLENHLEDECAKIRVLSFTGLALAVVNFSLESNFFKVWCFEKMDRLSKLCEVEFNDQENFDLLSIIVSLNSIDLNVFTTKPREVWYRELIISNLFQELKLCTDAEKLKFYSLWLQLEETHTRRLETIKFLFHLNLNVSVFDKSLSKINEALFVLSQSNSTPNFLEMDMEKIATLFASGLKQTWCCSLIVEAVANSDDFSEVFIQRLAVHLCKTFEAEFILMLFAAITNLDDMKSFESLIELCLDNKFRLMLRNIVLKGLKCTSVADLMSLLQIESLCDYFTSSASVNVDQMTTLYNLCAEMLLTKSTYIGCNRWTFEQLQEMLLTIKEGPKQQREGNMKRGIKPELAMQYVIDFFRMIAYYNLSPALYTKCLEIFGRTTDMSVAIKDLNKLIVENKFHQKQSIKNASQLLMELQNNDENDSVELKAYVTSILPEQLKQVKSPSFVSGISTFRSFFKKSLPIAEWDRKHIGQWADSVKTQQNQDINVVEAVAVIKRANYLETKFHLTDTQILAALISLNEYSTREFVRGKLLQVATGEGKSTIVCILAIVNALKSCVNGVANKVDIITSSPVLAERDVKDNAKLFRMFHLTCSFNGDAAVYTQGAKDCYRATIVYGEVSQFQFDKLRDEYSQLGTLARRQCSVAVVDEVDNMLVDDSSKIARLSSTAAGMDHFQPIYVFLWHKLVDVQRRFIMFDSNMYLLNGQVIFENDKVAMEYANAQGEIMKIPDLASYVKNLGDNLSRDIGQLIKGNLDEFLQKTLSDYLDALVVEKIVVVPANFEEFFNKQRSKWILNAVEALNYQENVHYVVHDGQIKPVDYFSTGIVQNATNWSDGLHQFLQLKHNLRMTCETLTTNFLSNISFINAYKKLFGLTGTLGSPIARKVLKSVYAVEMVNIPELRQKQYIEFPAVVSSTEAKWYDYICNAALLEVKKKRGVLIICETIRQVTVLKERLSARYRASGIKTYTMNNLNQETQIENVNCGDIVIATNLAGRGTNIHTNSIEKFGGMHVIVTFMPQNQRVQDQAFGRTARQGKSGTGQMILNMQQLGSDYENINTDEVKHRRDTIESQQLELFQNTELRLVQTKDELFKKFSIVLNENIRYDLRSFENRGIWRSVKDCFMAVKPTNYEMNVVSAVEEQWAMFLRRIDDGTVSIDKAHEECDNFLVGLQRDYKQGAIIQNLYYHAVIANDFIVNESNKKKAKKHFEKAIATIQSMSEEERQKKDFYGAAHFGIAWSSMATSEIKTSEPKHALIDSFQRAIEILSSEMAVLNASQSLLMKSTKNNFVNSPLFVQLATKATILGSYLNNIQQCMRTVKKSLRLLDILAVDNETGISELFPEIDREHNMKNIDWDKQNNKNKVDYQLTFNDLTMLPDSGNDDQACKTIDNAYRSVDKKMEGIKDRLVGSKYLSLEYKGIELRLDQVGLTSLRALLSKDKEFEEEMSAESAISQLTQERSYFNAWNLTKSFDVNFTTIHQNNEHEKLCNMQINDAINKIKKSGEDDPNLRYSFTIKNSNDNDIIREFWSEGMQRNSLVTFQISFDGIERETATEFVSMFSISQDEKAEIELLVKKADFNDERKSILLNPDICDIDVCINSRMKYQKVDEDELLKRVEQLEGDQKTIGIKIKMSSIKEAGSVIDLFPDSLYNITFKHVTFSGLWKLLSNREKMPKTASSFSFQSLDRNLAKSFIGVLRNEKQEFCLVFNNLSYKQTIHVIAEADLCQEAIELGKVRSLAELFPKGQIPYTELAEFAARGIEYLLEINEKRFIPWYSIRVVALLGTLQIVIGGLLVVTGFGATVGMSLISEGISDMIYAVRAYYNRQFDWSDYAKQKAVSFTISLCTAGFAKLKDAGKGVSSAVSGEASRLTQEATKEAVEAGATQFISNSKAVGQTMLSTGKNLKGLAVKFIGVKAGEAVVREGMNVGVQYLTNMSMDMLKPYIYPDIEQRVTSMFYNPDIDFLLRKMFALDTLVGTKTLQDKINRIVSNAVNPERDFLRRQWDSIGYPLSRGVLGTSENYGSAISVCFRIAGILAGLHALNSIISNVRDMILKKLTQIDNDALTTNLLLEQHLKIEKNDARSIAYELEKQKIDFKSLIRCGAESYSKNEPNLVGDTIKAFGKQQPIIGTFIRKYADAVRDMEKSYELTRNLMVKSVTDKIVEQILRIIDSNFVSPLATYATSALTDAISRRVQHYCIVDKGQNADELNEDDKRYADLKWREQNGERLSDDDKNFMNGFGDYRTVGQQIDYNARAYCKDYQRFATKIFSESKTKTIEVTKEVKKYSDDILEGKEAETIEISTLNKKFGVKTKITDDENYKPSQEEIDQGVVVIYIKPGEKDAERVAGVGHAQIVCPNGDKINVQSDGTNDCFYAAYSVVLQLQKGIDVNVKQLRAITAETFKYNSDSSKALDARNWINERYPKEARTLLFSAGLNVIYETDPVTGDIVIDPTTGRGKVKRLEVENKDINEMDDSMFVAKNNRGGAYYKQLAIMIKQRDSHNHYTLRNPNGSTTTIRDRWENPDGSITRVHRNGDVLIEQKDGTVQTVLPNQPVTINAPDGSVTTINANGEVSIQRPDGTTSFKIQTITLHHFVPDKSEPVQGCNQPNQYKLTYPNGTSAVMPTTWQNVDGSTTKITADGVVIERNVNGQTITTPLGPTDTVQVPVSASNGGITTISGSGDVSVISTNGTTTTQVGKIDVPGMSITRAVAISRGRELAGTMTRQERKSEIENLINQPGVQELYDVKMNTNVAGLNDGMLIHGMLSNNPNNTCPGPKYRGDDPKANIDTPIGNKQSVNCQNAGNAFMDQGNGGNLADLANIRVDQRPEWEDDPPPANPNKPQTRSVVP